MTSEKDLDGSSNIRQNILDAEIGESRVLPDGATYCTSDPEFVGKLYVRPVPFAIEDINSEAGLYPVRTDITVLPADEPKQLKLGWTVHEYLGTEIHAVQDGKPLEQVFKDKDGLKDGMQVEAWGGIWTVKFENGKPYLEGGFTIGTLSFGEDDRECWVCTGMINRRGLMKTTKKTIVG